MKTMKRMLALSIALVLLLSACGQTAPGDPAAAETQTSESALTSAQTSEAVTAPKSGFTFDDLARENSMSNLLSAFGVVQIFQYDGDALDAEYCYFKRGSEDAVTIRSNDPENGEQYACSLGNYYYEKVGDHLQFNYDFEPQEEPYEEDDSFEYAVISRILAGDVENIESAGEDTWRFELRDEEYYPGAVCRCESSKQTLTLRKIEWDYADGSGFRFEVRVGEQAQKKEYGLFDGFDRPLRTVKCVCTLHDEDGVPTTTTYPVDVPYNVEPLWTSAHELTLYLDKGLTVPYEYPGNGVGYVIYATDAMG